MSKLSVQTGLTHPQPSPLAGRAGERLTRPTAALFFLIVLLCLSAIAAKRPPVAASRLTIINKSGLPVAVQLKARSQSCLNNCDSLDGAFYYLSVPAGDREVPAVKTFDIQQDTYGMQLYYIESYDPVYGYDCGTPKANALIARRDIRLVVLPCGQTPPNVGEPGLRKFLPTPVQERYFFDKYWLTRLVY